MSKQNLIGISLASLIFIGSFWVSGGIALYWNFAALAIVCSGLVISLFMSYPFAVIKESFKVVKEAYSVKSTSHSDIVELLLDLSVRSKIDGTLSLEKEGEQTTLGFLKSGLILLVDNFTTKEIVDCLKTEMTFFNMRRLESERVFTSLAKYAPAFGVAGSVIGLIGLLMGIEDPQVILKHIPVAFISTLYGVIFSNMIFAPMAEAVRFRTKSELTNQRMILEGMVAIREEVNPYKLERRLIGFLAPEEREGKTEALRNLTQKYIKMRRDERKAKKEQSSAKNEPLLKEVELEKAS